MQQNSIQILLKKIETQSLWAKDIVLHRNEYLKASGSINTNLYYIVGGSLRIFFIDQEEQHTIRLGYKGNFIAALDSFISEKPSDLYIQAIKKCEIKVITKTAFLGLINQNNENMSLWLDVMSQLIYQQIEREKDLLTSSPLQRYQRVWRRSPHLFQEVPHKYIASYLRMTPETLSRIKKT